MLNPKEIPDHYQASQNSANAEVSCPIRVDQASRQEPYNRLKILSSWFFKITPN
jgi:hypothetical protein